MGSRRHSRELNRKATSKAVAKENEMAKTKRLRRILKRDEARGEIEALGFHPANEDWAEDAVVTVSAEHGDNAGDYYLMTDGPGLPGWDQGINPKLNRWAKSRDLYWVWVNPGVFAAYRNEQ